MEQKYQFTDKKIAMTVSVVLGLCFIWWFQYYSWSHESAMICLDETVMSDNFPEEYSVNTPPSQIYKDCKENAIEEREDYEDYIR